MPNSSLKKTYIFYYSARKKNIKHESTLQNHFIKPAQNKTNKTQTITFLNNKSTKI